MRDKISIFTGNAHPTLAKDIAARLDLPLGDATINRFPDGEVNVKIDEDIRGSDVFIIQPTCPPVNDHVMELLLLIDCCKRASAGRITAVIPYFGYARKDRKDEGRVPISAKLMANVLATAGTNRVLTIDLHSAQIQGFFDIPVDHLYAKPVMLQYLRSIMTERTTIVAPDVGSVKMVRSYAQYLKTNIAIVDKRRHDANKTTVEHLIGSVDGMDVFIIDDMISTGGSITQAANTARRFGARKVYLCATHPVLCGKALEKIENAGVEKVIVTNTIPLADHAGSNFEVLSVAPLLADAISRIHLHESVSNLFKKID
ncbi:MAG: ribose-phosphate pyrophosphokinase [Planctomycetes bacterium]|nr:ribose-phosphate pyrophosphokinase [Planctomycetota bacterium]